MADKHKIAKLELTKYVSKFFSSTKFLRNSSLRLMNSSKTASIPNEAHLDKLGVILLLNFGFNPKCCYCKKCFLTLICHRYVKIPSSSHINGENYIGRTILFSNSALGRK